MKDLNSIHNEYNFVTNQLHDLINIQGSLKEKLKKNPHGVQIISKLRNVNHDLDIIGDIYTELTKVLLKDLSSSRNVKFKFLVFEDKEADNEGKVKIIKG